MINLSLLIRSSINIVQIISYETMRIEGHISRTAAELKRDWYKWNRGRSAGDALDSY